MVGLVLRFWPEYVELQRRLADGELGRPLAVSTLRLSPPADWNDWMGDPAQVGRRPGRPADPRLRPDELAARDAAPRVRARAAAGPRARARRVRRRRRGSPRDRWRCRSRIRSRATSACSPSGGVAEYAFSAAPAEDGGNIGASDARARAAALPARAASRVSVPVEPADPWGPEIAYFVECVEQGRAPEQGTGAAGARGARRLAGRGPLARERAARRRFVT